MAATRLPFLYPQLLRTARTATTHSVGTLAWAASAERSFARATSLRRCKSTFAPRVGKAVAPTAWEEQQKTEPIELPPPGEAPVATPGPSVATPVDNIEATATEVTAEAAADAAKATATVEPPKEEEESPEALKRRQSREEAKSGGPLESVMHMEPPEGVEGGGLAVRPPTMTAPPYVHHFDSYSLVKQLEDGGYTRNQATTAMKAIRMLLAENLEVAQQSLVSKNDIENETYLFAAACSELNTEVKNNQRLQDERMRQERTHVQHEVDILSQTLAAELVTLNDNVRGMFNDRKMAARDEQKAIESAVQQLHYKISIVLTSDAKSEIEGVRWVLIQRSVLGIIFMALITLGALRYATFIKQQKKEEADKKRKEDEELRKSMGRQDHTAGPDAAEILAAN